jgi:hypothetical protein
MKRVSITNISWSVLFNKETIHVYSGNEKKPMNKTLWEKMEIPDF